MPFDHHESPTTEELCSAVERAAALLATERQWCRREEASADGRHCLIGALKAAGHADRLAPVVLDAAVKVSGFPYRRLDLFNDDILTHHRRVLAALAEARRAVERSAGERARSSGAPDPLPPLAGGYPFDRFAIDPTRE
jgi:hypothetical protein